MKTKIDDLEYLAEGRVSHVYLLEDRRVLKLAHDSVPEEKVADEYQRCRIVSEAGVISPQALERVVVEGRQGIIFEWAGEIDLMNARLQNPLNVPSGGRFMAAAHMDFLNREAERLPDIKDEVLRMAQTLPEAVIRPDQYIAVADYLATLPDGNTICHMDFHPGNIILDGDGHQVIDWSEAVKGAPEADIAMTSLILSMAETSPGTSLLLRLLIPIFRRMFERYYRKTVLSSCEKATEAGIRRWLPAIAISRMAMWELESEQAFLTDIIQRELQSV